MNTASDARAFCDAIGHRRVGVTIDTFHANIEEKNVVSAIRLLGNHLNTFMRVRTTGDCSARGMLIFPGIVASLRSMDYGGYLMIKGFGYSVKETNAPGALWADMTVSPEDIAFEGERYLSKLTA